MSGWAELKGRDLEAIHRFAAELRRSVEGVAGEVRFVGFRTLEVPPEAVAPAPEPLPADASSEAKRRARIRPRPKPPSEIYLGVCLGRRDVFIEAKIDELACRISLDLGTVIAPLAYTKDEWDGRLRATALGDRYARGEVIP